jgi:hypothetical protein
MVLNPIGVWYEAVFHGCIQPDCHALNTGVVLLCKLIRQDRLLIGQYLQDPGSHGLAIERFIGLNK